VLYAALTGIFMYGGIKLRKFYDMLVETAALTGAILIILGTALSMAWVIAQSGVAQQLADFMTNLPGGWVGFMAVTIIVFLVLGCLLEGLPAILLLAPLMFPIAKKLGINDVHYAMVVVTSMNIGLMMPPIGVGFYVACRIGGVVGRLDVYCVYSVVVDGGAVEPNQLRCHWTRRRNKTPPAGGVFIARTAIQVPRPHSPQ
jgi:TRAP-type C4-dicarboxylate transport system permease large subunit